MRVVSVRLIFCGDGLSAAPALNLPIYGVTMSLRKSTCLTPQRLDAARRNSQRSTGPRSEAGKERMKMNAVKHGCDAAPENEAAVMRALGEDPERYADLQRELSTTYGPATPSGTNKSPTWASSTGGATASSAWRRA